MTGTATKLVTLGERRKEGRREERLSKKSRKGEGGVGRNAVRVGRAGQVAPP